MIEDKSEQLIAKRGKVTRHFLNGVSTLLNYKKTYVIVRHGVLKRGRVRKRDWESSMDGDSVDINSKGNKFFFYGYDTKDYGFVIACYSTVTDAYLALENIAGKDKEGYTVGSLSLRDFLWGLYSKTFGVTFPEVMPRDVCYVITYDYLKMFSKELWNVSMFRTTMNQYAIRFIRACHRMFDTKNYRIGGFKVNIKEVEEVCRTDFDLKNPLLVYKLFKVSPTFKRVLTYNFFVFDFDSVVNSIIFATDFIDGVTRKREKAYCEGVLKALLHETERDIRKVRIRDGKLVRFSDKEREEEIKEEKRIEKMLAKRKKEEIKAERREQRKAERKNKQKSQRNGLAPRPKGRPKKNI